MELSDKEKSLYEFIKSETVNQNRNVTVESIKNILGEIYLGAIGKLIQQELIERKKIRIEDIHNTYGCKYVKCFVIKEKEEIK